MACSPPSIQTTALPCLRERARFGFADAVGEREPARDVFVSARGCVVGRRGDDRHQLRPALGGLADLLHGHPVGLGVELAPVVGDLRVVGELIIVAEGEAELFFRAGDVGLRRGRREQGGRKQRRRPRAQG